MAEASVDVESVYRVGDLYWKKNNDESKDWVLVKLASFDAAAMTGLCSLIDERTGSRMPNQSEQVDLTKATLCPANPLFNTYADMTSLRYLHEAALVKNLYDRWIADDRQPYTSMSNVLIAVNPLRYLKKLEKKIFVTQSLDKSPPHPFNVAENAYRQLRTVKQNQSIIISGESGSGKTETSKIILDFLTERSSFTGGVASKMFARQPSNQEDESPVHEHALGERLMETIPILESFGNAKTHRNHNSSRFGKYMRLQFSPDEDITNTALHLTGASIDTYLLETSRVVHPPEGERNFHVFYEILRSGDAKLLSELKLVPNPYMKHAPKTDDVEAWLGQYLYLNRSSCTQSDFLDDRANFKHLNAALTFAGINPTELFRIVAGVLHLGNLEFDEEDTPEGMTATIHREDAPEASIDIIAEMLGIKTDDLIDALLKKKIERTKGSFQRRGSVYFVGKTVQQAAYSRDTVAKMIYDQVFSSLMLQCADILEYNMSMKDELPYIGVLDIFGFEDFEPKNRNSFEQLLINYANEALQSMFNKCILKAEQELYQAENIWAPQNASLIFPFAPTSADAAIVAHNRLESAKPISYEDNRECLSLIADRREGILSILNTVGRLAGPSDRKLNDRLHTTFKKHPCFVLPHPRDAQHTFCIKHYAGIVRYRIDGFIDKNNNVASPQFKELISGSTLQLLNATTAYYAPSKTPSGSVSEMFAHQMKGLELELESTRNNFVRCIKPNPAMDVKVFDRTSVLDQLRCSGTIQACQVLQVGLPTRVSYEELVFIYSDLLGPTFMKRFSENDRLFTQALCTVLEFPTDAFRLGDTRLFFKTGKIHLLDTVLAVTPACPPTELRARLVSYLAKHRWISAVTKVVVLRACEEMYLNVRQGRRAIVLQCWFRQMLARNRVQKMRTQNRVAHQWSLLRNKIQVRAAFDQSVEDKLELLQVLLRQKVLKPNAKWLLTWLGPLQRSMYVRKLGRSACIAYLAKRAFSGLLEKVRRERAVVKLQAQFRRVLATKQVDAMRKKHRAHHHWARIRMFSKINICFLGMYRRAHILRLERDVVSLSAENAALGATHAVLAEKVESLEAIQTTWSQRVAEFAAQAASFADEKAMFGSQLAEKDGQLADVLARFDALQVQLDESHRVTTFHETKIARLEQMNNDLNVYKKGLEEKYDALDKMFANSKERNLGLVTESNLQVATFAGQVDTLQNKMNDMKHDVRMKTVQISELEEYNAELKDENENLTTQLEDMEQAHERAMANQIQQSTLQIATLTKELENVLAQLNAANQEIERRTMANNELEAHKLALALKNVELDQELERTLAESTQKVQTLDAEIATANAELSALNFEMNKLQLDLEEANGHIVLKSNKISELEVIKEQYKEKGTQLMEKMVQLEKSLAASKEKELAMALDAQKTESDHYISELTSQLKALQLQHTQAQVEIEVQTAAAEFEKFKAQMKADNLNIKEKMGTLATALADSKDKEVSLDAALTQSQNQVTNLQVQMHNSQLRFNNAVVELDRTKQALAAKSAAAAELENVRERLTDVHASLTKELDGLKKSHVAAKQTEEELDGQLAESTRRAVVLGAQLKQMQLELEQVQEHIAVKDAVVFAEETMKMQLIVDNEMLSGKLDATGKVMAEVRDKEMELATQVSTSNLEIATLLSQLETIQEQFDEANSKMEAQAGQLLEFDMATKTLTQHNTDLQSKVAALESALAESKSKEQTMGTQMATTSEHISTLTAQLVSVQRQFSQVNDQVELKTAEASEFESFKNQLKMGNMTLTEKLEGLIHIMGQAKERELLLEAQVGDTRGHAATMESRVEAVSLKLVQTEAQLEATLTNALELKATSTRLATENAAWAEETTALKAMVTSFEQKETEFALQLAENARQLQTLNAQAAQSQIQLEQALDDVTVKSSLVMGVEAMNAQLKDDLESTLNRLKTSEAIIQDMKSNEVGLSKLIAVSNDHICALETQLSQILSKFDYESDSTADFQIVPSSVETVRSKALPEAKSLYRDMDSCSSASPLAPNRADMQSQLKTATSLISNHRPLTPMANTPNIQAVFISLSPDDSAQSSRQELEARIDGNNSKVAALEAQVKLLQIKQEHFLHDARANESIEKLKATIAEKDNLIVELQSQIRLQECQVMEGVDHSRSSLSAVSEPTSEATPRANPVVAQLEAGIAEQQNLMRRIRKVVLQSRWAGLASPEDPLTSPEVEPEPLISRAFTSYSMSEDTDDFDGRD
ncbi:Aste57867_11217 [Aphanomyces stellatus]|uniref:Aste57867_11217 protein n=1 Tax=Aphanomyces stellatus TaxID=120398 RepID=A0A485KSX1_9STRA|nr:hypothetical protein As57867_011175 [Aphanomyces stellatus]VFT88083.1 Aste57867_11217 [Aphanomyces stellatus]